MKIPPALIAACLFAVSAVHAQPNQAANDDEDVFELSPFVVESAAQSGYRATSTLAGTRLNTQLNEVGAAVSVYTEDFVRDIDATRIEDILTYTTSTEGGGMQGNFGGFAGETSDDVRADPSGVNRVRALASATRTRDFFPSVIPADSYNFTTVTMSRGPNAILAGIGAPGGVIDVSLRQANFRDDTRLVYRYGKHGTQRGELHWNKEIFKDRFAVRLDAMAENEEFRQKPAYNKDRRLYGALRWNLRDSHAGAFLGRTTVRANAEIGSVEGVPPNMLPPVFSVQSWFDDGLDPRTDQPWASPKWRAHGALGRIYDEGGWQGGQGNVIPNTNVIQGFPLFRNWALVFADPASNLPGLGLTGDLAAVQGQQGVIPAGVQGPGGFLRGSGDRNRERAGFFRTRLMDRNVFDFYRHLMSGELDFRTQSFDAVDVRLEQILADGRAGVEIAYNRQNFTNFRDFPVGRGDSEVFIDTTEYLSIRTDAFNTGGPRREQFIENPNYGRPFIVSRDVFRDRTATSELEAFQATAFFRHDFRDADSSFAQWLGRHTLTGLFFDTSRFDSLRTFASTWDPQSELNVLSSIAQQPGTFATQVNAFYYIGDSMVDAATESDVRLNPITSAKPVFDEAYTLRVFDPSRGEFVTGEARPLRVHRVARDEKEDVRSYAAALQSHLLSDHVVTLVGWRHDRSNTYTTSDPDRLPTGDLDLSDLRLLPASSQTKDSWTKSIVAKYPDTILPELPFGTELRAYWNTSENFQPVGQRRNVWNEEVGSPSSDTTEFGIMLSALNGRFDLRINRFRTRIRNADVDGVNTPYQYTNTMIQRMVGAHLAGLTPQDPTTDPFDETGLEWSLGPNSFETFEEVARAFFETIPERMRDNMGPDRNFNPRFVGTGDTLSWEPDNVVNRTSLSDIVSRGTEFELIYNPTRNWRIGLNVSRNEAVQANVAVEELQYVEQWLDNVRTMYDGELLNIVRNPPGSFEPWLPQFQTEHIAPIRIRNALSGTTTPEIRKWRANLVTNYQFRDGFLDGFRVGGALRWQDRIGIGFPFVRNEEGQNVADVDNPHYGPRQYYIDLSFGYRRDINVGGRPVTWNLNVNIRNVNKQDDLIPVSANADGTFGTVRIPPERLWRITNSFRF